MYIAKILAGAAIIVAPLSIVTGQSSTQPDSGSSHHRVGKWLAGSGTAAGTALFLAFTHSSNGGTTSNAFTPPGNPGADPNVPTGVTTPPTDSPPADITPPPASDSTDDATTPPSAITNPPPADTNTATTPPAVSTDTALTPPPDEPPVITQDPFDPPHEEAPPIFGESSTVPEPGTLVLTATGIIGLIPLVRRRRK